MSIYAILGHGGFDQRGAEGYPTEVLIPPDTSLKFYAEAGQTLLLPPPNVNDPDNSGYERVAPVFDQVRDQGAPLTATMTTYNYCLYPDDSDDYRDSARRANWGSAQPLFLNKGTIYLCEGDPEKCPTPALIGGSEEDVTNPERWKHHCDGLLGRYAGHELHWLACASFSYPEQHLPATEMGSVVGPGAYPEGSPDWVPDDDDLSEVSDQNAENVKGAANKAELSIAAGGVLVLIGEGHDVKPIEYVKRQGDFEQGTLTVTRSAFGAGSVVVKGLSGSKQGLVEQSVALFSNKSVKFE